MITKSKIAALVAIGPCCILVAVSCGGSDYVDPSTDGSLDGAPPDGSSGPGDRDGTGARDGEQPGDGALGDGGDGDGPDAVDGGLLGDAADVPVLRSAKTFVVLAGQTVTNSGAGTTIIGNLGVSPGNTVTGLPPGQPVGTVYLGADAVAVQAQLDLTTLYDDLAARACPASNVLTGQDLAGKTLLPGVYCFASSAALGVGTLTLDANFNPSAFWIFQIGSTLDVAASTVTVINGGTACNVFWQVGSSVTMLDNARFAGEIVAFASVTLDTGASVVPGRVLARNSAVTMLSNQVSKAACP
jgi:hypothetical protein